MTSSERYILMTFEKSVDDFVGKYIDKLIEESVGEGIRKAMTTSYVGFSHDVILAFPRKFSNWLIQRPIRKQPATSKQGSALLFST